MARKRLPVIEEGGQIWPEVCRHATVGEFVGVGADPLLLELLGPAATIETPKYPLRGNPPEMRNHRFENCHFQTKSRPGHQMS